MLSSVGAEKPSRMDSRIPGDRDEVQSFLNRTPVIFGEEDCVGLPARDQDRGVGRRCLVDELFEVGSSFGDGDRFHVVGHQSLLALALKIVA